MILTPKKFLLCALLPCLCSCSEELYRESVLPATDYITFGMATPPQEVWNASGTRSADSARVADTIVMPQTKSILLEDTPLGEKLEIRMDVADMAERDSVECASEEGAATRSAKTDFDLGLYAYLAQSEILPEYGNGEDFAPYRLDVRLLKDEDYSYTPLMYWPGESYWLKFFSYGPYDDKKKTFYSVSAAGSKPVLTYEVPAAVSEQLDLLGTATDLYAGYHKEQVNLPLRHLLSSISFKVGDMPDVIITEVGLKNLAYKGTYGMNSAAWTPDGTVTQNFEQPLATSMDGATSKNQLIGQRFLMMPQTFSDNTPTLYLKLNVNNQQTGTSDYILERPLKDFTTHWEGGKAYIYTIGTPNEVNVKVTDVVEGHIKKNLVIKNSGMATTYIRASIIGEWVTGTPDNFTIVDRWEEAGTNQDGTFTWGNGNNNVEPELVDDDGDAASGWCKGTDGYYYYLDPVPANTEVPVKLFEKYELNKATASHVPVGARLVLTIVAQAVHVDDIKKDIDTETTGDQYIWPTVIVNKLKPVQQP